MALEGSFRSLFHGEVENSSQTWKEHVLLTAATGEISPHTLSKASKELGESEEVINKSLQKLRSLVQNGLHQTKDNMLVKVCARFEKSTDGELIRFLRARKYDVDRTLELMKGYVRYRLSYPELFVNINEDQIRKWVVKGQPGVLPHRDNQGRAVLFFRMENWEPAEFPFTMAIQSLVYVLEKLLQSEETQINGLCLIEDFKGYTMKHVSSVGLSDYKKMIDMLQGSFPSRFKGVHCIRQPWFFAKTYNLIKPLLKSKLFQRVYLYGEDLDEFYNYLPKDFLPAELGGTGPAYDGEKAATMIFGPRNETEELTVF